MLLELFHLPNIITFDAHRFESAAQFYVAGRPKYAARLIERVASRLNFDGTQKLLDLGTGPGDLAIAFAPYAAEVTAVDPEPEMLRVASEQVRKACVQVKLIEGDSYRLDNLPGTFDFVTIGRAFHWMDRLQTLHSLDKLLAPDAAVALFSTRHPPLPENAWLKDYGALIEAYGEPGLSRQVRRSPEWVPHESMLLNSSFSELERIGVIELRSTSLESLASRALSYSISSPGRIGQRANDLEEAIRSTLLTHAHDGMIREVVESEALLAFRHRQRPVAFEPSK